MRASIVKATVVVCVIFGSATSAAAQVRESVGSDQSSGLERRTRTVGESQAFLDMLRTTPTITGRFIPAGQLTGAASTAGLGLQLFRDPGKDGQFLFILRGGTKAKWPRPADGSPTATAYNLGADVQLTSDSNPFGQFIVSGDVSGKKGGPRLTGASLEWDLARQLTTAVKGTLIVTAGVSRATPQAASSITDFTPGIGYQFDFEIKTPVTVLAEYAFKNDIEGEDDYAISTRIKIGDASFLKVGIGKNGRAFFSLIFKLQRK